MATERPRPGESLVVGLAGVLGQALRGHLDARGLDLRAPAGGPEGPLSELAGVPTVVNVAGPRPRRGLSWADHFREHVGTALRVARSLGPGQHLVHVSSAAVYGGWRGKRVLPGTQEAPLLHPFAGYAAAKLAAEAAVRALAVERGYALTVLRVPLVYGGASGPFETLSAWARRGVVFRLEPERLRQHNLHLSLLLRAVQALCVRGAPGTHAPLLLADPFVLTNADWTAALALEAPRRHTYWSVSLDRHASVVRRWPGFPRRSAPMTVAAFAALALDNEYDTGPAFAALGLDPEEFSRARVWDPGPGRPS